MWDVFISHASEDKSEFVRPLANQLASSGVNVWYDEFSLKVGDSLRRSIDAGIRGSRWGVVVLSPKFFEKEWPQRELDGLLASLDEGRVLPVWHGLSRDDIAVVSPMLADRIAARSSDGIGVVVAKILEVVSPAGRANGERQSPSVAEVIQSVTGLPVHSIADVGSAAYFPDSVAAGQTTTVKMSLRYKSFPDFEQLRCGAALVVTGNTVHDVAFSGSGGRYPRSPDHDIEQNVSCIVPQTLVPGNATVGVRVNYRGDALILICDASPLIIRPLPVAPILSFARISNEQLSIACFGAAGMPSANENLLYIWHEARQEVYRLPESRGGTSNGADVFLLPVPEFLVPGAVLRMAMQCVVGGRSSPVGSFCQYEVQEYNQANIRWILNPRPENPEA